MRRALEEAAHVKLRGGMNGSDLAKLLLKQAGIPEVSVGPRAGYFPNHYDPKRQRITLSESVLKGSHAAAAGAVAHEVGHAMQHAAGYAGFIARHNAVRLCLILTPLVPLPFLALIILKWMTAVIALGCCAIAWTALMAVNLSTIGAEIDASRRGLELLEKSRALRGEEEESAAASAAWASAATYVGGFFTSIFWLLYHAMPTLGNRR